MQVRVSTRDLLVMALRVSLACGILGLAAASAQADTTPPAPHDCQCRAPGGERRDLGSIACVEIDGRPALVRCQMSMNTPFWKRLGFANGCELARRVPDGGLRPVDDALGPATSLPSARVGTRGGAAARRELALR